VKLMSINTHSILEEDYARKLEEFVQTVLREKPDIIAMQEVNQSQEAPLAGPELLDGFSFGEACSLPIRRDNHAAQVARRLYQAGLSCFWTWLPVKRGFGSFDEGLALFSLGRPIVEIDSFFLSGCQDYNNWQTRKALGIRVLGQNDWFYSIHMGWWQDREEPFQRQLLRLNRKLDHRRNCPVWLMGDFNSPAQVRNQGYDALTASGWLDSYLIARQRTGENTVPGVIDGWESMIPEGERDRGMRIDYIWCSRKLPVLESRVMFDGGAEPVISDHFGLMIETTPVGEEG